MQSKFNSTSPAFKFTLSIMMVILLSSLATAPVLAGTKGGSSTDGKSSWKNHSVVEEAYSLSIDNRPPQISGAPALDVTISEDSLYTLRLNATDPNPGDIFTWRVITPAKFGAAAIKGTGVNPELAYKPNLDFNGEDTFTIQVSDLSGAAATLPVKVKVIPANDFSEAADFSASGSEDSFLTFSYGDFAARFTDPEGAKLQAVRISPLPSYGTLFLGSERVHEGEVILPGLLETLIYLPDNDWFGSDSFGWAGSDGSAYSQVTGEVILTIAPANDNPQITDDLEGPVVMDEDGAPRAFSLILHAADVDLVDSFTWSILEQPENGIASISAVGFEATLAYQPARGYSGDDAFIVSVEDGKGGQDTLVVEIEIQSVNNSPLVTNSSVATEEEEPLEFDQKDFLENYTDDADQERMLGIRITALPTHGELHLDDGLVMASQEIPVDELDSLVYTPSTDSYGTDTFAWAGCDGKSCSDIPATLSIEVANLNDPPQIQPGETISTTMDEDGSSLAFNLTLNALDPDPEETLTWSLLTPPANGTAIAAGTGNEIPISYTPLKDFSGSDEFTVQVTDAAGEIDSIQVLVQVNPANDLPVVSTVATVGTEDNIIGFTTEQFTSQFTDLDADLLTAVRISSLPAHGSLILSGALVKSGHVLDLTDISSLTYQPDPNYAGMDYFQWTGSDGKGWASPGSLVSLTIAPVEDAPTLAEIGPFQIELTSGRLPSEHHLVLHANDKDNDPLSWILVNSPAGGTLLATGEGYDLNLDYVPNNLYQGTDTFTIHLTDEHTAPVVIEITVSGKAGNNAPASADSVKEISADQDTVFLPADFPITDLDGDALQALQISSLPAEGTLYLDANSDGSISDGEFIATGQTISIEEFGVFKYKPIPTASLVQAITFNFLVNDGSLSSLTPNIMLLKVSCPTPRVYIPMLVK